MVKIKFINKMIKMIIKNIIYLFNIYLFFFQNFITARHIKKSVSVKYLYIYGKMLRKYTHQVVNTHMCISIYKVYDYI